MLQILKAARPKASAPPKARGHLSELFFLDPSLPLSGHCSYMVMGITGKAGMGHSAERVSLPARF